MPVAQRMQSLLARDGALTMAAIAGALDVPVDTIVKTAKRHDGKRFIKLPGTRRRVPDRPAHTGCRVNRTTVLGHLSDVLGRTPPVYTGVSCPVREQELSYPEGTGRAAKRGSRCRSPRRRRHRRGD